MATIKVKLRPSSVEGKSTLLPVYYFGGSEICHLSNFSLSKIISL